MRSASGPGSPRRDDLTARRSYAAMDLLGQRWVLRIIWELEPGPLGFLELRRRMGNCSSSMLSVRLQSLQDAGLVLKRPDKAYELTHLGISLSRALEPVWSWSQDWAETRDT